MRRPAPPSLRVLAGLLLVGAAGLPLLPGPARAAVPARHALQEVRGPAPAVLHLADVGTAPRRSGADVSGTTTVPAVGGPALSEVRVTYTPNFPTAARTAFDAAAAVWQTVVTSSVPITVTATWEDLGASNVLGATSPGAFYTGQDLGDGATYYPKALVNALSGLQNDPRVPDISASFNSGATGLYFGTDGNPPLGQTDFETIVLHELGHGLGMVSDLAVDPATGRGSLSDLPDVYDIHVAAPTGLRPVDAPDGSALLTGELRSGYAGWSGGAGRAAYGDEWPSLYAPSTYAEGSSFSHLDEASYPQGDPDSLMTPFLAPDEVIRDPGAIVRGVLADMGWHTSTLAPRDRTPLRFTSVQPTRLVDTRRAPGPVGRLGPGGTVSARITGGLVATGASAVVLNVTAVAPSAGTFLAVYPAGTARPGVSNVTTLPGETIAGQVTVALPPSGVLTFYNAAGSVDVLADVAGYYSAAPTALRYTAVAPTRLLDTRRDPAGPAGPRATRRLVVAGVGTVPADVAAVVLNVTAVPSTDTFVSAYPSLTDRGSFSNLNLRPAVTLPNLVTVKVGGDGAIVLYNDAGTTQLIADLAGYYSPGAADGFVPVAPRRVLDTRSTAGPVAGGTSVTLDLSVRGLPAATAGIAANVTAVAPTAGSFVTAYPAGGSVPTASNLNLRPYVNVANAVDVALGTGGQVGLYNAVGSVHLVTDLGGYFVPTS